MEQESIYFGENGFVKMLFIKIKEPLILMKEILKE